MLLYETRVCIVADDDDFADAIDQIVARDDLNVRKVSHFGTDGECGSVRDWKRNPSGSDVA